MTERSDIQQSRDCAGSEEDVSPWMALVRFMQRSVRWQGSDARRTQKCGGNSSPLSNIPESTREQVRDPREVTPDVLLLRGTGGGEINFSGSGSSLGSPSNTSRCRLVAGAPPPPPPPPPPMGAATTKIMSKSDKYFEKLPQSPKLTRSCGIGKLADNVIWNGGPNLWKKGFDTVSLEEIVNDLNLSELSRAFELKEVETKSLANIVKKKINFLEAKRVQAISIALKFLKLGKDEALHDFINSIERFEMPQHILDGGEEAVIEKLRRLNGALPTQEEADTAMMFRDKIEELGYEDRYCVRICEKPCLRAHVVAISVPREFEYEEKNMLQELNDFTASCDWIIESEYLRKVMLSLLVAANYLNSRLASAKNSPGFLLAKFATFVNFRSNDRDYSLLEFVLQSLLRSDGDKLKQFVEGLSKVTDQGGNISLDDLRLRITKLDSRIQNLLDCVDAVAEDYRTSTQTFLEGAKERIGKLHEKLEEARCTEKQFATYVCDEAVSRLGGKANAAACFDELADISEALTASLKQIEKKEAERKKKNPVMNVL